MFALRVKAFGTANRYPNIGASAGTQAPGHPAVLPGDPGRLYGEGGLLHCIYRDGERGGYQRGGQGGGNVSLLLGLRLLPGALCWLC